MRRTLILVLALALPLAAGKKKFKGAPLLKLPEQTVDLANFTAPLPSQKCANWASAIAIESMLRAQDIPLDQHYWVGKVNLGEVCVESPPDLDKLVLAINGAYILDDGRHVALAADLASGLTDPEYAIGSLRLGHPLLMVWKTRVYIVRGAVYDEFIYPNNQRLYQIRELKLLDPLASGKARDVSFLNGRDDPADVSGLTATTASPASWQTKTKW